MSRKPSTIINRLEQLRWAASSMPPPNIATEVLRFLEHIKIVDHEWESIDATDRKGQQLLWWDVLAVTQYFLASQGQESPALNALISALQNTTAGIPSEKRLEHPERIAKFHSLEENYARAQVIATINKAPPGQRQKLLEAGAKHLKCTSAQVNELVKNYRKEHLTNRMLRSTVQRIEHQLDRGYGPDLDGLREANLL
jgi:hypothetical protein